MDDAVAVAGPFMQQQYRQQWPHTAVQRREQGGRAHPVELHNWLHAFFSASVEAA